MKLIVFAVLGVTSPLSLTQESLVFYQNSKKWQQANSLASQYGTFSDSLQFLIVFRTFKTNLCTSVGDGGRRESRMRKKKLHVISIVVYCQFVHFFPHGQIPPSQLSRDIYTTTQFSLPSLNLKTLLNLQLNINRPAFIS